MFLVLQMSVICKKINYCSRPEIDYNPPKPLEDESINTSNQVVNTNSSKTSNLDNITKEVTAQDSNDINKTKNMKISVLNHSN